MAGEVTGVVTDIDGNAVEGATVYAVKTDVTPAEVRDQDTTGTDGGYSLDVPRGGQFHIISEWDDGTDQYNSRSRPFIQVESEVPASGVSRWTFDDKDTSGDTAIDFWGGNDGTINGATTGVTGANQTYETNEAYSFDGSNDFVSTPFSPGFGTGEFSITCWYNADNIPSSDQSTLASTYNPDSESAGFIVGFRDGDFRFWINGDDISATDPGENQWVFSSFVRRGGTQYIYTGDANVADSQSSSADASTNDNVYIARRNEDKYNFDGIIEDVRIFNKGLSETEISNLYNTGSIDG